MKMDSLPEELILKIIQLDGTELALTCKKWCPLLTNELLNDNINKYCTKNLDDIDTNDIKCIDYRQNTIYTIFTGYENDNIHILIKKDPRTKIYIRRKIYNPSSFPTNIKNIIEICKHCTNTVKMFKLINGITSLIIIYNWQLIMRYSIKAEYPGVYEKITEKFINSINPNKLNAYIMDLNNWHLSDFVDQSAIDEYLKLANFRPEY